MSDPKNNLRQLMQLVPFLVPYRWVLLLALLALLLTAAITLSMGQGVRLVIDQGIIAGSKQSLQSSLLLLMVLVVLMAIGTFVRFYLVSWLGERVVADIRQAVFSRIIKLHPSYFEQNRSGEIMSRLTTDTSLLQSIIGSSLSWALRSVIIVIGASIMLIITNFKLTLIVLSAVPAVLVPIVIIGRRVRKLSRDSQNRIADVGTYAGEIVQQIKTVQSYAREEFEQSAFGVEVEQAFDVARARIRQRAMMSASVIILAFSAIVWMFWVGGQDVLSGNMTGGELAAFSFYAIMAAFGMASVSEIMGELQRAAGATERLLELLAEDSLIHSPETPASTDSALAEHVVFNNVSFSYPSRPDLPVINQLSLTVRRGETLALVGPSGAGKSTLFELLLRFYDPQEGEIKVSGADVRQQDLTGLRTQMALVPQQPVLFSNNVRENIRYGKPDASNEEVEQAAKSAFAHDFILGLPESYDSYLGENGVRLSGGQKQRIVIARALLNDPDILLLDEATSALDAESEYQVQTALEKLVRTRTTIIIAHRLATVKNVDRILVMDKGRALISGTHNQLLDSSPLYARLAALQFGDTDLSSEGDPADKL